jgi:predicted nuclease of predicted toxin-antitoxin system
MPLTPDAVSHLQAAGHDAIHASSVGLAQATDREIIEIAQRDGRVVVTADLDYPRLVLLSDVAAPGIVLILSGSYSDSEMLVLLDRVLAEASRLDLEHSVTVIDRHRISHRRLPTGE